MATYFELHAIQRDWSKACLAALHMYLLNPPIWYLTSTINNLKILHQATRLRDQQKLREQLSSSADDEDVYSFWIDFFSDAINSNSSSTEERELPAQVPVSASSDRGSDRFGFFALKDSRLWQLWETRRHDIEERLCGIAFTAEFLYGEWTGNPGYSRAGEERFSAKW